MSPTDFSAHPMLDPDYLSHDYTGARGLIRSYLTMSRSPEDYNRVLNRLLNPIGRPRSLAENLEAARRYLVDVNAYVREVLELLPADVRRPFATDPEVAATNDTLALWDLAFRGDSPIVRYEAQRKLYLAKLLFDIDHEPGVRKGPEHKAYFENLLDRELWVRASRMKPVDLWFDIDEDGRHMRIDTRRSRPEQESWRFYLMRLRRGEHRRPIHVYHYACRFKREVAPQFYEAGADRYEVAEKPIWETLHERRSGSILSKMIRKGEVHPRKIQDIIGAMFIVKNEHEVEELQEELYSIFGGPLRWKDRVNTIARPEDRTRLNPHSGVGYEVLKSDVDVLHAPDGDPPYIFSVEIQIYTVEGYLRTVHNRHYASHQKLKLRQFLEGLLPLLFPEAAYGEEAVGRAVAALERDPARVG